MPSAFRRSSACATYQGRAAFWTAGLQRPAAGRRCAAPGPSERSRLAQSVARDVGAGCGTCRPVRNGDALSVVCARCFGAAHRSRRVAQVVLRIKGFVPGAEGQVWLVQRVDWQSDIRGSSRGWGRDAWQVERSKRRDLSTLRGAGRSQSPHSPVVAMSHAKRGEQNRVEARWVALQRIQSDLRARDGSRRDRHRGRLLGHPAARRAGVACGTASRSMAGR